MAALALVTVVGVGAMGACSDDADESGAASTSLDPLPTPQTVPASLPGEAPSWPGRRDPCELLTEAAVTTAVGFDVLRGQLTEEQGGGHNTCTWGNAAHGVAGGAVTVTVVPPGTDLDVDRAALGAPIAVEGLPDGATATLGTASGTLGAGATAAVVTVDDSGFTITASTFEFREDAEMEGLVRTALERWSGDAAP